ncbi:MAG: hypothetical protein KAJ19_20630 [Gammaproteobacteria bacterium]|nr:hypothetical protein [Gammaproteobacteria bacterium]
MYRTQSIAWNRAHSYLRKRYQGCIVIDLLEPPKPEGIWYVRLRLATDVVVKLELSRYRHQRWIVQMARQVHDDNP